MVRIRIAVYGKGGIGKSTISANLSAALADKGNRVLQIGCDPKHDSTRLLLGGKIPTTALEYIKDVLPAERRSEEIVYRGYGGVACVEAGGPEPGVGCAGRGIITTFELLDLLGIKSSLFDVTLYDVLGDVVCGGFAVPIRKEYADAVYIVTSGEYLSLYAANNILRGIRNFTENKGRVAGIIYNARGLSDEDDRVRRFAEAVHLPVIVEIPRSEIFARAEKEGCTLIERYPDSREAGIFRMLADHVDAVISGNHVMLHPALPLSDEDLERTVLMRKDIRPSNKFILEKTEKTEEKYFSNAVRNKRPLIGCAFAGAVSVTAQISDAATVMHCPRSCALMIHEKMMDTLHQAVARYGHPHTGWTPDRLVTTDMTDEDFIFGGEGKLQDALISAIGRGYGIIFIVTACPPGIIGDDIGKVIAAVNGKHPGVRIIPVKVDGNIAGDFAQGVMDAYNAATGLIDSKSDGAKENSVNIIAEKYLASNAEKNLGVIRDLLGRLGIGINCRFLTSTDADSLRQFNDAGLNLPADQDDTTESIRKMLAPVSDVPFLDRPFPTGFAETRDWLMDVAAVFGKEEEAEQIIAEEEAEYRKSIGQLRPELEGKSILISTYPKSIDWICDIAEDLGMNILKAGLTYSPFCESLPSRYAKRFPIVQDYTIEMRTEDIRTMQPDLVLYTYPVLRAQDPARSAHIPYCPGYGFHAAVERARRWKTLMKIPVTEGWKNDGGELP